MTLNKSVTQVVGCDPGYINISITDSKVFIHYVNNDIALLNNINNPGLIGRLVAEYLVDAWEIAYRKLCSGLLFRAAGVSTENTQTSRHCLSATYCFTHKTPVLPESNNITTFLFPALVTEQRQDHSKLQAFKYLIHPEINNCTVALLRSCLLHPVFVPVSNTTRRICSVLSSPAWPFAVRVRGILESQSHSGTRLVNKDCLCLT